MKSIKCQIRKAVFPVAGFGTRFLPATKSSPKEMLPVVNKPLIQYAVEEAYAAGIREMIFVTSFNKRSIEDHFDISAELENELMHKHKHELLAIVDSVRPPDMECVYIRQSRALGLGNAVLCAETLVGNEYFAVLLADDLMISKIPVLTQMTELFSEYQQNILAVEDIPLQLTEHYGIIQAEEINNSLLSIRHLIEKPQPSEAPSNTAIVGRYILSPAIFNEIKSIPKADYKEIQLTDAIQQLLNKESVLAYRFEGVRYDCGSILGFLMANVDLGKQHPEIGEQFSQWLFDSINGSGGS